MKIRFDIFWILLVLFILFRLSILFTSIDQLYNFEELYRGAIAKEVIDGLSLPLFDYLYTDYEGGSLFEGILAIPFFLILGQTYFSLKLVTFLISVLIFSLWYYFLNNFFGKTEAVLASILITLSPPAYTKISLTSWGNHFESNLFAIVIIILFYKYFFAEASLKSGRESEKVSGKGFVYYFSAGAVAGVGIFFSYTFFIPLAIFLFLWFACDKKFILKKPFLIFTAGFLLGFSPVIYFNITHNFVGFNVKGVPIYEIFSEKASSGESFLKKFYSMITLYLPNSFCFKNAGPVSGKIINYSYYCIFSISYLSLLWLNHKKVYNFCLSLFSSNHKKNNPEINSPVLFILFLPVSFILILSLAPFKIGVILDDYFWYRYLTSLFQFQMIIISIFISYILKKGNESRFRSFIKPASYLLLAVIILIGISGNIGLISFTNPTNPFLYKGYNYFWLGQVVVYRYGFNLENSISVAERLNKDYRGEYYEGLGYYYGWAFFSIKEEEKKIFKKIDPYFQNCFYKGVGINYSLLHGKNMGFNELKKFVKENIPESQENNFYIGFSTMMAYWNKNSIENFINGTDNESKKYLYYGMGRGIGKKFGFNELKCREEIEKAKGTEREYYYRGFQEGLKEAKF